MRRRAKAFPKHAMFLFTSETERSAFPSLRPSVDSGRIVELTDVGCDTEALPACYYTRDAYDRRSHDAFETIRGITERRQDEKSRFYVRAAARRDNRQVIANNPRSNMKYRRNDSSVEDHRRSPDYEDSHYVGLRGDPSDNGFHPNDLKCRLSRLYDRASGPSIRVYDESHAYRRERVPRPGPNDERYRNRDSSTRSKSRSNEPYNTDIFSKEEITVAYFDRNTGFRSDSGIPPAGPRKGRSSATDRGALPTNGESTRSGERDRRRVAPDAKRSPRDFVSPRIKDRVDSWAETTHRFPATDRSRIPRSYALKANAHRASATTSVATVSRVSNALSAGGGSIARPDATVERKRISVNSAILGKDADNRHGELVDNHPAGRRPLGSTDGSSRASKRSEIPPRAGNSERGNVRAVSPRAEEQGEKKRKLSRLPIRTWKSSRTKQPAVLSDPESDTGKK